MAPEPGEMAIRVAATTKPIQVMKLMGNSGRTGGTRAWRTAPAIAGRPRPAARYCLLLLRVDGGLQGRAGSEARSLRCGDLDDFAGCRVATLAGSALGDRERAEAGD